MLTRRLLAVSLLLCFASSARADDVERTEQMRELFERGQEDFVARRYELAASEFRAAYELEPAAALLFNEAVCYENLNQPARAAKLFGAYLDAAPNAKDRAQILQRKEDLERRGAPSAPTAMRGVVLIDSRPSGATIYLDDTDGPPLGTTPWNGSLEGTHTVILEAKGYVSERRPISGRPSTVTSLFFALAQPDYLGFVQVFANVPNADVYIDEVGYGTVGPTPYRSHITPGKHRVIVTREGLTRSVEEVEIEPGKVREVHATLEKAPIGYVTVHGSSLEGASVKLDGVPVCQAPCRFRAPSGQRRVTVEKPGRKPYERKLTVGMATETDLAVRLATRPARTDLIWKYGLAAAALGGGVYLGLKSNQIRDGIERDTSSAMPPLPSDDDRHTRGKIYAWTADGLFLVGASMAVYSTLSLLSEQGPASSGESATRELVPGLSVAPAVGPGYQGVAAEMRF